MTQNNLVRIASVIFVIPYSDSMNVHELCEYSASTIIVQFTQSISYRESLGRHYLGTTEGDNTDDLQGNRKVGRQLRCPSLEYQCKRHQHQKDSDFAERSLENSGHLATGSHKMSSIGHLHNEATVKQYSDLLSAQYLVQCLGPDHVYHNIAMIDDLLRQMKHTL